MSKTHKTAKRWVTLHSMDSHYLKKQLICEIEEAIRVKELNLQLMEQLAYTGHWILNYCHNNNIHPSNTERLLELIEASKTIVRDICEPYNISDESLQRKKDDKSDDNVTEPYLSRYSSFWISSLHYRIMGSYLISSNARVHL